MRVAVFGGTGATGRHIVEQALAAGHTLTVLARDPARLLSAKHDRLTVVQGSALSRDHVVRTVAGADAVLSALGGASLRDEHTVYTAAALIVEAMQAGGARRIVLVGSAGIFGEVPGLPGLVVKTLLRHPLRDHRRQYEVLCTSGLDWILVRAVRLGDGPRTGVYRVAREGFPRRGSLIARADVADFMIRSLTDDSYLRSAPAIAY